MRNVEDIIKSFKIFIKRKADGLITGTRSRRSPYFNVVEIINRKVQIVKNIGKNYFRRQDVPKTYDMNASIYIWKRKTLIKHNSQYSQFKGKTVLYEMPAIRSVDIDSEIDFKFVEFLLKNSNKRK